jgi:hypothetical protein
MNWQIKFSLENAQYFKRKTEVRFSVNILVDESVEDQIRNWRQK